MDGTGYYNNYNHLGWTELVSPPLYSRDGSRMVTVISTDQGQNVGFFPHIVIFRSVAQSMNNPVLYLFFFYLVQDHYTQYNMSSGMK